MPLLSKSKYMQGLRCPRLLWYAFNEPEEIPDHDDSTKELFRRGRRVGELARALYDGELVEFGEFQETIDRTKELVRWGNTVFEASFKVDDLYCRVDILQHDGGWNIIEVKSSTKVKDRYIEDVAFQKFCLERAGLDIQRCFVMHINSKYERDGELEPERLFSKRNVTDRVEFKQDEVRENIIEMREIIERDAPPERELGMHRNNKYRCDLGEKCYVDLPEHDVTELHYIGDEAYELAEDGVLAIQDIPDGYPLTEKQSVQRDAVVRGEPQVRPVKIREFLERLEPPLYFLDFEAFNTAVPLFDGVTPYEHVPFQFSLHLEDEEVEHHEFLYDREGDPRPELAAALHEVVGDQGSIVAYNTSFEQRMLRQLSSATDYDFSDWHGRFVDLAEPFREFWYYDPEQHGSYSLKAVLPCIAGEDYDDLDVSDGDQAAREFVAMNYRDGPDVREELLAYCERDTEALIRIRDALRRVGDV